jgi:hypothetical protein
MMVRRAPGGMSVLFMDLFAIVDRAPRTCVAWRVDWPAHAVGVEQHIDGVAGEMAALRWPAWEATPWTGGPRG